MQDKKVLMICHIADSDGITPLILARLVGLSFDKILLEPREVDETILKLIETKALDYYDQIMITDLCPTKVGADAILNSPYAIKVQVLDHHFGNMPMNEYPFIQVIDQNEFGKKESGTSLFWNYLKEKTGHPILDRPSVERMVELVRQMDTWDFTEELESDARKLGDLFHFYGREEFEEHYVAYLQEHDEFSFTLEEQFLLVMEQKQKERYLTDKEEEIIPIVLDGHSVGVVFAERYRSEVGNFFATKFADQYDYFIVINVARSVSYRGIKEIDLSKVAQKYGGNGHFHASGSSIPNTLLKSIIHSLYPDAILKEEEHGL